MKITDEIRRTFASTKKIIFRWHEEDVEENTFYYPIYDIEGGFIAETNGNPVTEYDIAEAKERLALYCPEDMADEAFAHWKEEFDCVETCKSVISEGYGMELDEEDVKRLYNYMINMFGKHAFNK